MYVVKYLVVVNVLIF